MAVAVTVKLSTPHIENASTNAVAKAITSAGAIAPKGLISGIPGIAHNANQFTALHAKVQPLERDHFQFGNFVDLN